MDLINLLFIIKDTYSYFSDYEVQGGLLNPDAEAFMYTYEFSII